MHRSHAVIHPHHAGGQRQAVGRDADAVHLPHPLAATFRAEPVFAVRQIDGAHGIGHKREAVRAFHLVGESQQLRRQVLAVGDDFGREFVEEQRRFHDAGPHRVRLRLPQSCPVGHGAEEVIDVLRPALHGGFHLRERGVRVADVHLHAALGERAHRPFGVVDFRGHGDRQRHLAREFRERIRVLFVRREELLIGVATASGACEVWAVEVQADDAGTACEAASGKEFAAQFQEAHVLRHRGDGAGRR